MGEKGNILRLNYTNHPQPFKRFSLGELQQLNPDICPYCGTRVWANRVERDIVGGKYLAYVVHPCDYCGWWNLFKFWEDRTGEEIYACRRSHPLLKEFDIASKDVGLEFLLRLLKHNFEKLREVHFKVFERLIQRLLSEHGYKTIDISQCRSSGGDLLAFSLDGKRTLVEVKHWKFKPVGVDVVWKLKGALQDKGYERGLIVTSNRFTRDALEHMSSNTIDESSLVEDQKFVTGADFSNLAKWLDIVELRPPSNVLEQLRYFIDDDAMSEM